MDQSNDRMFVAAAMIGWAGVGAYGVWEMTGQETSDGWERPYLLFTVSLLVALAATAAAVWTASGPSERPGVRRVGAGFAMLSVVASLVAWALPLWATLLAIACAMFAVGAPRRRRRGLVVLAAAPVVGLAVMLVAIEAEIGRQDSYGDYPAAFGLGTTIIAAGSVLGLMTLARQRHTTRPDTVIAAGPDASATV